MPKPLAKSLGAAGAGVLWGLIAFGICACFGMSADELIGLGVRCMISAVATSAVVTLLFSRRIFRKDVRMDKTLPLAAISTGVPIWCLVMFSVSALLEQATGHSRGYPFDGFWLFLIIALGISLTIALPLTYYVAFATQRFLARCAGFRGA